MYVSNSLNDATGKELGSEISIPNLVPKIGVQFVSENHAYIFYNEYAGSIGFSVRKDFVNKRKEDEIVKSRRPCAGNGRTRTCELASSLSLSLYFSLCLYNVWFVDSICL